MEEESDYMSRAEINKAARLVKARNTLKVVWVAYRDSSDYIDESDRDVRVALEVALDEIDLALLRLDNVNLSFELRDGNENDSQ